MNTCSNLFYLSSIACGLSECLSEKELTKLSADLVVLSDMLANILAQRALCVDDETELQRADSPKTPNGDCLTS